ncbi:unnamed protein product [Ostreobium quekettii]|uniref:Uncharacterized protein n=1 Tax=Ostreobium quekettii TaxID=121088 RepID=A0A8S1IYB6_9CHLO|nr:unnamed protein product [Ostreobium quekettii]|eukprot:evm.model.scf_13EXC.16 EVM.evm.TU.scf_13EXC.16   scf_13EXC:199194-202201(+)
MLAGRACTGAGSHGPRVTPTPSGWQAPGVSIAHALRGRPATSAASPIRLGAAIRAAKTISARAQRQDLERAPSTGLAEDLWEPGDSGFGRPNGVSAFDYVKYVALAVSFTAAAYTFHPQLVAFSNDIQETYLTGDLLVSGSRLFSFLSLVFSILVGSTFKYQYGRQQACLSALYDEVLALEIFWRQIEDKAPGISQGVAQKMRAYINGELCATTGNNSPFRPDSPIIGIVALLSTLPKDPASELRQGLNNLSVAHTKRAAAAVAVLPLMHWVMLWALVLTFLGSYLIFETPESVVPGDMVSSQRLIFALLSGLSSSIVLIVQDLSKPVEGTYSLVRPLGQRLKYLRDELLSH